MRNKKYIILWLLLVMTLSGEGITAESIKSGTILGAVIDRENHPLPGATATLVHPDLSIPRTFITSEAGLIIFPSLPPEEGYRIQVEMPGFKTLLIPGIPVQLGKTTQLRIQMTVTTIAETITVPLDSQLIDMRSSGLQENVSREIMNDFPFQRQLDELIQSVSGGHYDK